MKLYLNELAPWERKQEYYQIVQIGKDVNKQIDAINSQTKDFIKSNAELANKAIVSKDKISDLLRNFNKGIDDLTYGIEKVSEGIAGLQAAFEWGISEVIWQIEQNREILKDILEVLMAPLDTQAKELRKRAQEAYYNGWFDDALFDFLESEKKNRYDFIVHISIGLIYFFHQINKEKAVEYFDKAIKYSQPKSKYHAAVAYLYKALLKYDSGETEEAISCTEEAIKLFPELSLAYYENAQFNAVIKNVDNSLKSLKKAIEFDKYYCIRADNDPFFEPIKNELNQLFLKLRDDEKSRVQKKYNYLNTKFSFLNKFLIELPEAEKKLFYDYDRLVTNSVTNIENIKNEINKIETSLKRNTYYDLLDIDDAFLGNLENTLDKLYDKLKYTLEHKAENFDSNIKGQRWKYSQYTRDKFTTISRYLILGLNMLYFVLSFSLIESSSKFWGLSFLIVPYLFYKIAGIRHFIFHHPFISNTAYLLIFYFMVSKLSNSIFDTEISFLYFWIFPSLIIISLIVFLFLLISKRKTLKNEKISLKKKGETVQDYLAQLIKYTSIVK